MNDLRGKGVGAPGPSRPLALIALGLGLCGLQACGSDQPPGQAPGLESYFETDPEYAQAACRQVDSQLAGQREMLLYSNGAVDLKGASRGLARYYQRHGLSFYTQSHPRQVEKSYALNTDSMELTVALIAAFPEVDFADAKALTSDPMLWDRVLTFVLNFMVAPIVEFARLEGTAGTGLTNLVVIPDLERPGGQELTGEGQFLGGLAVSPALLATLAGMDIPEGRIWKDVQFPADFTPMMFLSSKALAELARIDRTLADLVVAHEFGHTAALLHRDVQDNLMFPSIAVGRNGCTDSLAQDQLATMSGNLRLSGMGQPLRIHEPGGFDQEPLYHEILGDPFTSRDLRALMTGNGPALRKLLRPVLHTFPMEIASRTSSGSGDDTND